VVAWLVRAHGVCLISGSACGAPGYVRVAFANLLPEQCAAAAGRLRAGLAQLVGEPGVLDDAGPRVAGGGGSARGAQVVPA